MIWLGIAIAVVYWFLDSLVMLAFEEGQSFLDLLLTSDKHELWMRSMTAIACIGAGFALDRVNRRREEALSNAEALARDLNRANRDLSSAARVSGLGFWTWDVASGRFVFCSDRLAALFGYADGESMRADLSSKEDFLALIHPDDRAELATMFNGRPGCGDRLDTEFRIVTADRETRYLHALVERAAEGSVAGEEVGIVRDISDARAQQESLIESRSLLRAVVDAIPAAIDLRDRNDRYLLINNHYARMLGCADAPFDTVADVARQAHERDPQWDVYRQFARQVLRTGAAVPYTDVESDGPDGHFVWYTSKAPIESPVTGERLVLTVAFDVTAERSAAEQLQRAQRMEAVGQLTAGLAHDFNNLLAVIRGNADMLADTVGRDDVLILALIKATDRGAALTQRLLAFARRQVLQPTSLDANRLISDLIPLIRRTLESHIDIELSGDDDLWNCEADPAQLENALLNLVLNARDAMPRGGHLTLETRNIRLDEDYAGHELELEPGDYVQIAVADSGSGMSEEVRSRVFEPFFTTKPRGEGSGLGLSMVYGFAKQSGGHIGIYSEPDKGTTVKLYLPMSPGPAQASGERPETAAPVGTGESVLLVEDDPDVRAMTAAMLTRLGYRVWEAEDAGSALALTARSGRPDLLLTDVVLKGDMDGKELSEQVRRQWPDLPVLFMSGYTENGAVMRGRMDGEAGFLQKPFARDSLATAIRQALEGAWSD